LLKDQRSCRVLIMPVYKPFGWQPDLFSFRLYYYDIITI
jgi:hypothetical protein